MVAQTVIRSTSAALPRARRAAPAAVRRSLRAALPALAAALLIPSGAAAATLEIGAVAETRAGAAPAPITSGGYTVQASEGSGSYAVPPGYTTIVAWSHSAGSTAGLLTFKVLRPTGRPQEYVAVGADTRSIEPLAVRTFPVRIPVLPGDRIGLSSEDVELAYESGSAADRIGFFAIDLPLGALGTTDGEPFPSYRLAVTATLATTAAAPAAGAPGSPGAGGGAAGRERRAPRLTSLRLRPARFRAARRGPTLRPARSRAGAKVTYRVSAATRVHFSVRRLRGGRRAGRGAGARCVAPTSRNRRAARCLREIPVRGSFTRRARSGLNSLRFSGRLAGRSLRPGAYRLVATPRPRRGAPARRRTFRIAR